MRYDLMVTRFENSKAKMIIARNVASRNSDIPLQKALAMMEELPVTVFHDIDEEEMKEHVVQFTKIGVRFKAVQVSAPPSVERDTSVPSKPLIHMQLLASAPVDDHDARKVVPEKSDIKKEGDGDKMLRRLSHKRRYIIVAIVVAAFCGAMALLYHFRKQESSTQKENLQGWRTTEGAEQKQPEQQAQQTPSPPPEQAAQDGRRSITDRQRAQSGAYLDSAVQTALNDPLMAVNFFKMAIAYNRYNLNAWFGLINAYRDAGIPQKVIEIQHQMEAMFGETILSVNKIVNPYGNILDAWKNQEGVFRLEYRTRGSGKEKLTEETFLVVKALRTVCGCNAVSLFAETGSGRGMLVYIPTSAPLVTIGDFTSAAKITFLE
jgi:hypothetical protein